MEATFYTLLTVMAILLASGILLLHISARTHQREQVSRKLEKVLYENTDVSDAETETDSALEELQRKRFWSLLAGLPMAPEIQRLVREAGYAGIQPRLIFAFINLALPLAVLAVGLLGIGLAGIQTMTALLVIISAILAFLIPRWVLRWIVARRRAALSEEIPVAIQLLLMLFEAGLSVEHALRILRAESEENRQTALLPEFSRELKILFHRVDAGGSLATELTSLSNAVGVQELGDMAAVLKQVLRRGGDIRQSLINLVALIEERRQTRMQERAGEIAGRMSMVMILFMFPALIIFIAGPGFLAILEGLRSAAS